MRLKIIKVCEGIFDTDIERSRIAKAFKKYPEIQEQLTKLVDAVEARNWEEAIQLLNSDWWQGSDENFECRRLEFIGSLRLKTPNDPDQVALGFEYGMDYLDLISTMSYQESISQLTGYKMRVEPVVNLKGQ